MSNNFIDKNTNFSDNNFNQSSKNNVTVKQKGSLPEHLIFFKEDVLKDIKQLESKISLRYDTQQNINSNKINKIESMIEQINQRIEYLSTFISEDNSLKERVEKISNLNSKLDESLILQDVRIKNIHAKLIESIDKYDKVLSQSIIYPSVIGPKAKFKIFHDFIDFVLFNINQLILLKDKLSMDLKDFKYKIDSLMSNLQIKLDYFTKNANAFTNSSIRVSEKKMEQIIRGYIDEFRNEFEQFKNQFKSFHGIQENKILHIIENTKRKESIEFKDENSKRIETLEKILKNFEEENKKMKAQIKKLMLINENNLNNSKRSPKKSTVHFLNDYNVKNATSIVKEYIKGKITENEVYRKRRSVNAPITPDLESIKEYNSLSSKPVNSPSKKNRRSNIKHHTQRLEKLKDLYEESEEDSENEEEEEENELSSKNDNNVEKNYEFQKHLFRVSGNDDDLIIERGRKSRRETKTKNSDGNSALKYIKLSRQLYQKRKSSMNSVSNNSDLIENQDKKQNNNNGIINLYITNSGNLNKNSRKVSKTIEPNKSREKENNESSILEKSKKYEKIKDVKTIIKVIKKESRDSLIPILPLNKIPLDKLPNNSNNKNDENKNNKLDNQKNINNKNSFNIININSRNKNVNNIKIDSINQNYSRTKGDYSKIKFINTPLKLGNQKYTTSTNSLKLPLQINKKINKSISAGKLTTKNKGNATTIDINFSPYEDNSKEKEEKKMQKIFNQMKDYLPLDEKAMIKDRFIKYGFNKEKIFNNEQQKNKNRILEEININRNTINGFFKKNKI